MIATPQRVALRFDPHLSTTWEKAEDVTDIRTQVRPHMVAMYRILDRTKGLSLAAQQVGISRRFFVWRDHQAGMRFYQVVINPVVTFHTPQHERHDEADLSRPGVTKSISRPIQIRVSYTTAAGDDVVDQVLTGLPLRVFMHEIERQRGVSLFGKEQGTAAAHTPVLGPL